MSDLTYNIVEMRLTGIIDGKTFDASAFSGGRAGSKQKNAVHPILANNPFLTGVKKETKDDIGGSLPLGMYELKTHEDKKNKKNWIRLNPVAGTNMKTRGGMAIHGRGQRGSDGCIVPEAFDNVLAIHALCAAREKSGRAPPTLEVVAIGDLDHIQTRMANWASTA